MPLWQNHLYSDIYGAGHVVIAVFCNLVFCKNKEKWTNNYWLNLYRYYMSWPCRAANNIFLLPCSIKQHMISSSFPSMVQLFSIVVGIVIQSTQRVKEPPVIAKQDLLKIQTFKTCSRFTVFYIAGIAWSHSLYPESSKIHDNTKI